MTFGETYKKVLSDVMNVNESVAPRGQLVKEIINYHIEIDDVSSNQIIKTNTRSTPIKYLKKELCLYYSGTNDIESFKLASKVWDPISDNGIINSAYGHLIFNKQYTNKLGDLTKTQFDWVIDTLINDPDSRQAVMYLGSPQVQYDGVKDFICTFTYQFFIRNNKLNMICNRRSNDVYTGIIYDIPWELTLMQVVCKYLKRTYPEILPGTYYSNIGSLHAYERNWETINNMLKDEWSYETIPSLFDMPGVKLLYHQNDIKKIFDYLTTGDKTKLNDIYYELIESKFGQWLIQYK